MRSSFWLTIAISFLVTALPATFALADSGPSCGPYVKDESCNFNPENLSDDECYRYCENTDFCMPYQEGQKTVFGGYWRNYGPYSVLEQCKAHCESEQRQCDQNDQACQAKYEPLTIDCTQLTDNSDQQYCHTNCVNTILTSECGRACVKSGVDNKKITGCKDQDYCSNLCANSYCKAIPLEYETKWNVFGILMLLLAAMSGIAVVVMNKKSKGQNEDTHS